MVKLALVTYDADKISPLKQALTLEGFACAVYEPDNGAQLSTLSDNNDLALVFWDTSRSSTIAPLIQKEVSGNNLPIIAIINIPTTIDAEILYQVDDIIVAPVNPDELILRIKRLLQKAQSLDTSDLLKCKGLIINTSHCEVILQGKILELTFKEYELLKLLANHPGQVFTREVLLDRIWGFDYFGGTRTVDVHITRLRGKIDDSVYHFIETVRSIGYRFTKSK